MRYKDKLIAVFDFDGVIYKGHSIFDFIKYQEKDKIIPTGTWDKIQKELNLYVSRKKDYNQAANSMLEIYAKSLSGELYERVKRDCKVYLNDNLDKIFSYVESLFKKLKSTHDIYIISTNFQFTVESVCEMFDLAGYISSIAETRDGVFTGKVKKSLAGNKDLIKKLFGKYPIKKSIAVGDSENDIKMLENVKFPICFEPNEILKNYATKKKWIIADEKNIRSEISKLLRN